MRSLAIATLLVALAVSAFATEADLQDAVQEDLIRRPYLKAGRIRVRTEGQTVTLNGRVPDETVRAVVVQSVRNVPGVKVVKDHLAVDATLPGWKPTLVERTRLRLENARRVVRGDPVVGVFTTLHVARTRRGIAVSGDVSSHAERARLRKLLELTPAMQLDLKGVRVRPDATRRVEVLPAKDPGTVAFVASVSAALRDEPLLAGKVDVKVSVEREALVLRGTASDLVTHDLAIAIAHGMLAARQREAALVQRRSGPLTTLVKGEPTPVAGEVPQTLQPLVFVLDQPE